MTIVWIVFAAGTLGFAWCVAIASAYSRAATAFRNASSEYRHAAATNWKAVRAYRTGDPASGEVLMTLAAANEARADAFTADARRHRRRAARLANPFRRPKENHHSG